MEIKIDYYLKQDGMNRIMHTTIREDDLMKMLHQQFMDGDLGCPIHFDREKVKVEFVISQVII